MTEAITQIENQRAEAKRKALRAAEAAFESAFERLIERTDLRRCMDALGRVCEGQAAIERSCEGFAGAARWNERAEMLYELGEQFQALE